MKLLEQKLEAQFAAQRAEIRRLKENYGSHVISQVSVAQLYGGMRGVTAVVCDTSEVNPQCGLIIRGKPVKELLGTDRKKLLWLLLTGELPTEEEHYQFLALEAWRLSSTWPRLRAIISSFKSHLLHQHPIVQACFVLQQLQRESILIAHSQELPKSEHWRLVLRDAIDIHTTLFYILQELAVLQVGVESYDSNFAELEHNFPETGKLQDLYVLVHCDHEGSNACALACRTAASTLADPYLALTAGWRALAGPIHGLASQVCIEFIDEILATLGPDATDQQLAAFVQARIDSGRVIPGFGHAVLRAMDPRYELLRAFAKSHFPDDPSFRIADGLLRVVPPLLMATGKVANPWPNVFQTSVRKAVDQKFGAKYGELYKAIEAVR